MKKLLFITCLLTLFFGCKVNEHWADKYSTKHPHKYTALTDRFISNGGCKGDTTSKTVTKDSSVATIAPVYIHDTFKIKEPGLRNIDTTLSNGAHFSIIDGVFTASIPVHDSIHYRVQTTTDYIRDLAEENLLREDSLDLSVKVIIKDSLINAKTAEIKDKNKEVVKLQLRFWGLIVILGLGGLIALYLKLKPKITV